MPSLVDSFCMTVYEALACETPVIISSNVGAPIEEGENGFVGPIRNPDAIAEKILFFMKNRELIEQFGSSGKKMIAQFSWNKYVDRLVDLYDSLKESLTK